MTYSEDLDCKIFVDANCSHRELLRFIARVLSGIVDRATVQTALSEVDVQNNDDFDEERREQILDGFLYFRYFIEIYPLVGQQLEHRAAVVATLLERFWSQGWPAVAACDYEHELPNNGGYQSGSVPWPQPHG